MSIFLITARPNWLVPVFRQTGFMVEYKRFPADYTWRPFLDLSDTVYDDAAILTSIGDLQAADITLNGLIVAAGADIVTALTQSGTALVNAANAQTTADEALAAAAEANGGALDAVAEIKRRLPMTFSLMSDEFVWEAGTKQYATSSLIGYNWTAFSVQQNAVARHQFVARAGKYTINILCQKASNSGTIDFTLDGNPLVTALDLYAAAANNTFIHTITNVTVNDNGDHDIAFGVPAKNPSSSGYYTGMQKIWGFRTGD